MNRHELAEMVREAQDKMLDALDILKQVQRETDDEWARGYIIGNLETVITRNHGWLSRDANIDDWIDKLTRQGDYAEDETEKDA